MRTYWLALILPLLSLSGCIGCGDGGGGAGGSGGGNCGAGVTVMPTADDVTTKIFNCSCVFSGCHDSRSNRTLRLNLETATSVCTSVRRMSCEFPTKPRTDKNNVENSILIKKLTCASADCTPELGNPDISCQVKDSMTQQVLNRRMPASDNPPLDSGRVQTLRNWIAMDLPGCPPPDGGAPDGGTDGGE